MQENTGPKVSKHSWVRLVLPFSFEKPLYDQLFIYVAVLIGLVAAILLRREE